ncbi:MAG: DUF885 domain-containing protein [Candidatus Zixiibacteriota bacterium]|nr:MAG: DUF885 domain-containing protein [candidate division Zixibacteria bacterium]
MLRRTTTIGPLVFSLIILGISTPGFGKKRTFEQRTAEILECLQSFDPVRATELGIHSYDHRLADYSSRAVKDQIKKLKQFEQVLYGYRKAQFSQQQKIDYKLIKSNVDIALQDLDKIKWHRKLPQLYIDEAVDGIFTLMVSRHAPMSEKIHSILGRMRQVPDLFATARRNIKNPPQVWIDLGKEALESGLEFYRRVAGQLMAEFPEKADEILQVSTAAREAMNDYLVHLSGMEAGAETAFAIGRNNYDYKLLHEYFLPFGSDSLLKIGQSLLEEASRQYSEYEENVETNHQNGLDSVFVPASFSKEDLLDYYSWECNQVRTFLESENILSLPDSLAPVQVIEATPALSTVISGNSYQPAGPFERQQTGYFYVRPVPDDIDRRQLEARYRYVHRRGFRGPVVREVYPGRHLQMQIATQQESDVRRWQQSPMMIEGWALYVDELMHQRGLYGEEDPAAWLTVLGGIRFSAACIVAEVKLQTGQFTYDQCTDWLVQVLDARTESAELYLQNSVRRLTLAPTAWMTPLIGRREIKRLREACELAAGPAFVESDFHDRLLAEGSIPPALLWEIPPFSTGN